MNSGQVRKWGEVHSEIFGSYISKLNLSQIKYFILRNYAGLPEINTSKDIDIIIEPKSYSRALELLCQTLKDFDIENIHLVKYERAHCCYGISLDKHLSIHIDLIEGYLSKGFEIFSFNDLYKQTKKYKSFYVLNDTYDAILLLYYKVIATKQLKPQYQSRISRAYETNRKEMNSVLRNTLGKKLSGYVIRCLEMNDFDLICQNAFTISKSSKFIALRKKPWSTTLKLVSFIFEKIYRVVYCPRKYQNFISVQGADGTGKSTFIDGLVDAIAFYYVDEKSKSHVYHHRPKVLPNLGAAGEKIGLMKEDKDYTNPHRARPGGVISSFVRMTYYWLDYVIGVPFKLRRDVQFDKFTIYDRYIYDFLVDPHRSRINLPYRIRKLFIRLVPQPRIVFVLLTDADIIYKRKQELSIVEINRQLGEFRKLAASHKRFVILDASRTPEELVRDALKVIIKMFTTEIVNDK